MYKIINRHVYELSGGENVTLCDIMCDDETSLPDSSSIISDKIAFGSIAYLISERKFVVLNSLGEWL